MILLSKIMSQIKMDWHFLWGQLGWIDLVFIVVFILGIVVGLKKGLEKVLPRCIEVLVAQTIAVTYHQAFSEFTHVRIPLPLPFIKVIMFAALAVGALVATGFVLRLLGMIASIKFNTHVNNVGGALLNSVYFILVLSLLSSFLLLFSIPSIQQTLRYQSLSGPFLSELTPTVQKTFEPLIPEKWKPLANP
ncbi:MAG: hypothetical protein A3J52_01465 [Omnitrophica bacterium RIFCSPHIGHO2_02_FULL_49_9]|nr:MAG: hypothetical protein A3J52_01465 [Omnitrophica bacterium RIFCSPHIGHO2_02_FULL_49_9]OGW88939.1 MAG: hypothetical protein A3A73_01430 [Omnitrophica bacterium RIFCSPLOWO2_01_FULL_50_24]